MRSRFIALATAAAVLTSLGAATSASAAIEIKVSSKYVSWPNSATVKVRTTTPGETIEFRQERLDRRRLGTKLGTSGWSCVTPPNASASGYQEAYRTVAKIENPPANEWLTVRIPATKLEFTRPTSQGELTMLLQGTYNSWVEEGCVDPWTRYTRIQAKQNLREAPVGTSLTRLF